MILVGLMSAPPVKREFDEQYREIKALRNRISKVKKNKPNFGGKYMTLPPLIVTPQMQRINNASEP